MGVRTIKRRNNIFILTVLIGSGIIYQLSYLKNIFYMPMIVEYNLTHFQLGMLSSVYALISMFSYLATEIVLIRFTYREMMTLSFIFTGIIGVAMFFTTEYYQLLIVFALFGFASVLFYFLSSLIINRILFSFEGNINFKKYVSAWRGITSAILAIFCVVCFNLFGGQLLALRIVVLIYSVSALLIGIVLWVMLPDFKRKENLKIYDKSKMFKEMLLLLKQRKIIYWCIIVACSFAVYIVLNSFQPLLVLRYGYSIEVSLFVGIFRYIFSALAVYITAVLLKNVNNLSKRKLMIYYFTVDIALFVLIIVFGENVVLPGVVVLSFFTITLVVYGCREIYFGLFSIESYSEWQQEIVWIIIAFVGYFPEICIPPIMGRLIDNNNDFESLFLIGIAFSGLGILTLLKSKHFENNEYSKGDDIDGKYSNC